MARRCLFSLGMLGSVRPYHWTTSNEYFIDYTYSIPVLNTDGVVIVIILFVCLCTAQSPEPNICL